jgi:hypothetical protein
VPASLNAVANIITAMALLGGTVPLLIKALHDIRKNTKSVNDVHKIVNQQRTDMQRYQRALVRALENHGIDVPVDQSLIDDEL